MHLETTMKLRSNRVNFFELFNICNSSISYMNLACKMCFGNDSFKTKRMVKSVSGMVSAFRIDNETSL